jgi:hypothetical protein
MISKEQTIKNAIGALISVIFYTWFFTLLVENVQIGTPQEVKAEEKTEVKVVEKVVEKPISRYKEPDDIEGYIIYIFGKENGEKAIKMLKECENKTLDPEAENWNANGTWDFGLFQINQIHGKTKEQLKDWKFNTRFAYQLFVENGYSFSPWTCSYILGEKPFYER